MLPVSQTWRNAITEHRTKTVRNAMRASVYIGAFDESASGDAVLSKSGGEMYYSDFLNINMPEGQAVSYATFEQDSFRGDGVQTIVPPEGQTYERQGWVTSAIADGDGEFSEDPVIITQFSTVHSMIGLTLIFDPYHIARDFNIKTYRGATLLETYSYTDNELDTWTDEMSIENADKIVITFTRTDPYNRIHVQTLLYGIGYTYDNDQLIDFSYTRSNSPLSLSLPQKSLSFTLFNEDYKFNVDRKNSLIRFLKSDQKVVATMWYNTTPVSDDITRARYWYDFETGELMFNDPEYYDGTSLSVINGVLFQNGTGYTVYLLDGYLYADDSARWEQLKLCTLWLTSWDVSGSQAKFKCDDTFQRLNNIDYRDSDFGNTALNTRLDALMTYAGYSDYQFSPTTAVCKVFPESSVSQILQMSANLMESTLEEDPDAVLIIRPRVEPEISTVTALGSTEAWSVASSIKNTGNATYTTFEINFYAGDGSQTLMGTPYLDNGITWSELPVNNLYSNSAVQIELADNSTFGSLHVEFPQPFSPSDYTVTGYRYSGGSYSEVYSRTVDGSTSDIADVFDRIKRIRITINGCYQMQKARLKYVSLGWETGYDIVPEDIVGFPTGRVLTACRDVIADTRSYTASTDTVGTADCPADVEVDIRHNKPATNVSASASTGTVTIIASHAWHTVVKTSADAKVTLTGTIQEAGIVQKAVSVNVHGEDLEIDNPLISTLPSGWLDWAKAYASKDTEFEAETLGFPELEAADLISYKGEPAQIIRHDLSFSGGACRSKFTLRKE